MKITLFDGAVILFAAPACVWPGAHAAESIRVTPTPSSAYADARVTSIALPAFATGRRVAIGMSRNEVVAAMLGRPDDTLSTDVWIYWNFSAPDRVPDASYTALLVIFEDTRVKLIRLADAAATRALLVRRRAAPMLAGPSTTQAAATK